MCRSRVSSRSLVYAQQQLQQRGRAGKGAKQGNDCEIENNGQTPHRGGQHIIINEPNEALNKATKHNYTTIRPEGACIVHASCRREELKAPQQA